LPFKSSLDDILEEILEDRQSGSLFFFREAIRLDRLSGSFLPFLIFLTEILVAVAETCSSSLSVVVAVVVTTSGMKKLVEVKSWEFLVRIQCVEFVVSSLVRKEGE
jgi:hypothetical protein